MFVSQRSVEEVMARLGYDELTARRHVQSRTMAQNAMRERRSHFLALEGRRHVGC